ncbi:MAG: hypothetical protein QF752_07855 [Planctomycetota bacterium]|nr:hypothetical protein [Planctomycetota bacterium]
MIQGLVQRFLQTFHQVFFGTRFFRNMLGNRDHGSTSQMIDRIVLDQLNETGQTDPIPIVGRIEKGPGQEVRLFRIHRLNRLPRHSQKGVARDHDDDEPLLVFPFGPTGDLSVHTLPILAARVGLETDRKNPKVLQIHLVLGDSTPDRADKKNQEHKEERFTIGKKSHFVSFLAVKE